MIIVKEKKSVPHADARCGNCGSLLQYGNADLLEDYQKDSTNYIPYMVQGIITILIALSAGVKYVLLG